MSKLERMGGADGWRHSPAGATPQRQGTIGVFRRDRWFAPTFAFSKRQYPNGRARRIILEAADKFRKGGTPGENVPSACMAPGQGAPARSGPQAASKGSQNENPQRSDWRNDAPPASRRGDTEKAASTNREGRLLGSGQPDLNRRPLRPERSALPDCAMPRLIRHVAYKANPKTRSNRPARRIRCAGLPRDCSRVLHTFRAAHRACRRAEHRGMDCSLAPFSVTAQTLRTWPRCGHRSVLR